MSKIEYDKIECDVVWVGDKSCKIFAYDLDDEIFVPLSCFPIGEEPEHKEDGVILRIASWFCVKEGLV